MLELKKTLILFFFATISLVLVNAAAAAILTKTEVETGISTKALIALAEGKFRQFTMETYSTPQMAQEEIDTTDFSRPFVSTVKDPYHRGQRVAIVMWPSTQPAPEGYTGSWSFIVFALDQQGKPANMVSTGGMLTEDPEGPLREIIMQLDDSGI